MQKVLRTGNSLAIVIPSKFVNIVGIRTGDQVKVITKPEVGRLTVVFSGSKQLPLDLNAKKSSKKHLSSD